MGPESIGRDLDAAVDSLAATGPAPVAPDPLAPAPFVPSSAAAAQEADLASRMDLFPRGAAAGTLLHDVLERVDFGALDETRIRELAAEALGQHGFDAGTESHRYPEQILHVVRSVAATPLRQEPDVFRLADVRPGQLRPEMEFTIAAGGERANQGFTPLALSALLRDAPADSPLQRYAERVARLGWRRFEGFLRGFIDAVFHDGQRYYLIDYKSNHLGSRQVDYAPENLVAAMIEHDYVLQSLIYCVALDRHLSQTLEGYAYAEHFGGAYYLFVRGLSESHAPGCGIYHDRPPEALIRGVSALLGSDARSGRQS
jgi:exodeoxyribonuclease V beta subunit